jgi:hypothetical protein
MCVVVERGCGASASSWVVAAMGKHGEFGCVVTSINQPINVTSVAMKLIQNSCRPFTMVEPSNLVTYCILSANGLC